MGIIILISLVFNYNFFSPLQTHLDKKNRRNRAKALPQGPLKEVLYVYV